jgi:class 3 adenylate cyclase/CHASE2 domain-containing sensor protein
VKRRHSYRLPAFIALGVFAVFAFARLVRLDFFEESELGLFDHRVRLALRFPAPAATNLGFVSIEQGTIDAVLNGSLGYRFGLYWPRQVYGRLVEELHQQGARAVAIDVLFKELRPDHAPVQMADGSLPESDEYFADQLRRAGNVVIAATEDALPPGLFRTNAAAVGDISTEKDLDGKLRRARAFQWYRQWHPVFEQLQGDRESGADLSLARKTTNGLVLPLLNGNELTVPLDAAGTFALADFLGSKIPAGMSPRARPFTEIRVWHMGIVLAAKELGADLEKAIVDLEHGRITLRTARGQERVMPVDSRGYFYIDWRLPPNHSGLEQEPMHWLLLQHRKRLLGETNSLREVWRDKLVVVGSAAAGNDLTDWGATPLESQSLLASKHWNVANSIITGRFVHRSSLATDLVIIAALVAIATLVTSRFRILTGTGLLVLVLAAYAATAVGLYVQSRIWVPLALPLAAAMLTYACVTAWRVVFEQAEQRRIKSIFSTIVSDKIAKALLEIDSLALGGARREITVLFADIRGFTGFTDRTQQEVADEIQAGHLKAEAAESLYAEQARETLKTVNLYLGSVADVLIQQDGTLDKYIGDCVMAFWGAPTESPNHAVTCVRAAIDAQRAVEALNRERAAENARRSADAGSRRATGQAPRPLLPLLQLGTGINTGMAIVGLMGSEAKTRNYTVFGREVNLASRLEGLSGAGRILISEATFGHLRRDDPELASRCVAWEPISVKGFRNTVRVFEVPWKETEPSAPKAPGPVTGA